MSKGATEPISKAEWKIDAETPPHTTTSSRRSVLSDPFPCMPENASPRSLLEQKLQEAKKYTHRSCDQLALVSPTAKI